jgi:ATP-binding cassette subfamily G (WHITE) protein 2 (PDR)
MLFQRFDRLLFLAKGGRTVYFGEVGDNANILTKYFERNGAHACPPDANPAEWMLEVIGAAPGSHTDVDWHETWRQSPEYQEVHRELDNLKAELSNTTQLSTSTTDKASFREFAAPFGAQLWEVTLRVFKQYWRTPSYIYSKGSLCVFAALFIGFSFFDAGTSQQELQNQMFAIFMLFTILGQLVQQIMPNFVTQRALYEVRERPSKTYSWKAFMISNIFVERPWNSLMAVLIFICWYYPIGLYRNAEPTDAVTQRGGLMFLLIWEFLLFTSTFTNMVIAAIDTAEVGGNIAQLMFSLTLVFCGVLATPSVFPRFWIFMYRVSPFTYLVDAMLSVGIANTKVVCATNEFRRFNAPAGKTCGEYMAAWISTAGGYLEFPEATGECSFCSISDTNQFLAALGSNYEHRWRNFGILWAFIIFNAVMAVFLYWLFRVPKTKSKAKKE